MLKYKICYTNGKQDREIICKPKMADLLKIDRDVNYGLREYRGRILKNLYSNPQMSNATDITN